MPKMSYEQTMIYDIILIIVKYFYFLSERFPLKSEKKTKHNLEYYDLQVYKENLKIVGIAKPVGKWTKMIILSDGLMQCLVN